MRKPRYKNPKLLIPQGRRVLIDDYGSSMPNRLVHYMSDKDTSSDLGNGFKNLVGD